MIKKGMLTKTSIDNYYIAGWHRILFTIEEKTISKVSMDLNHSVYVVL